MTPELKKRIDNLLNGKLSTEIITFEGLTSYINVNEGAKPNDINKCELYFHFIPADYLSFLRNYNGAFFFKFEDIGGFEFWNCDDLIKHNRFQKEQFGDQWDDRIILICNCVGDGDFIGIKVLNETSYEIVDCYGEEIPASWPTICKSFDVFLDQLLEQKGRRFWLGNGPE